MYYNYHDEMKKDVMNAMEEHIFNMSEKEINCFTNLDNCEKFEELNALLWVDDSVTGSARGSYFLNTWKAEEAISHNWELLEEAANEFGIEPKIATVYKYGPEWWDVTIRCYLLGQVLDEVIAEMYG